MAQIIDHPHKRTIGAKRLNLALQGDGSHGAFTWGALDHLLEDGAARDCGDFRHLCRRNERRSPG